MAATISPSSQSSCPSSSSSFALFLLLALLCLSLPSSSLGCSQKSCIAGFRYEQIPGFTYSNVGCQAYNVSISAPFGLSACCQSQTACYHNCTDSKTQCDAALVSCMTAVCDAQTGDDQSLCNVVADAVNTAVTDTGCSVYSDAQAAACECSNGTATYFISAAQHRMLAPYAAAAITMLAALIAMSWLL